MITGAGPPVWRWRPRVRLGFSTSLRSEDASIKEPSVADTPYPAEDGSSPARRNSPKPPPNVRRSGQVIPVIGWRARADLSVTTSANDMHALSTMAGH